MLTRKLGSDIVDLQTKLGIGEDYMDKAEILKMAQREGNDEMESQIRDHAIKWTYIAMVVLAAIFSYIRAEQGYPMMDLTATVSASVCVGQFYRFLKNKDKSCLFMAVITFVVAIIAAIRFFMGH